MNDAARQTPDSPRGYRFDSVGVDLVGRRLVVDGRERAASRRAFDLLVILCESPGRVLTRERLADALWPGGQIVSDEALTQAIFRVRAALGQSAERVVTIRGVGIRFDADVRVLGDDDDARVVASSADVTATPLPLPAVDEPSTAAGNDAAAATTLVATPAPAAQTARPQPVPRGVRRRVTVAAVLVAIAVGATLIATRPHTQRSDTASPAAAAGGPIDEGFALAVTDVHASRDDTVALLREAMRHENVGDRARARALLETLHDVDTTTPTPALLLALWSAGAGDGAAAGRWLVAARARIAPLRDPYQNALLRYVEAEAGGNATDVIRYAGALLDLRPTAWRMHLARAHLMWSQGLREAALGEIVQVEVRAFGNRKLELALADRAAFGDVAGARAALARLAEAPDDPAYAFLEGRIAWSAGDIAGSRAAYERAAEQGRRGARNDIVNRATANAGVAALAQRDEAAAIAHFERARVGMNESGWVRDEIDMGLLLAQLHARRGDAAAARAEFAQAVSRLPEATLGFTDVLGRLIGARIAPDIVVPLAGTPGPETLALIEARRALIAGDRAAATVALAAAVNRGVYESRLADEARLVAAELGQPVPPAKPFDPPYPPLAIVATRLAIDDVLAKR